MKPEGVTAAPPAEAVAAIAEEAGFVSREKPKPAAVPKESPAVRKRVGGRKKGRSEALNIRVKPEVYNRVRDICDSREYGYAEFFDEALEAWLEKYGSQD